MRMVLLFLTALFSLSISAAEFRCWKPHRYVYRARYWVEIAALPHRSDLLRLEFGIGTDSEMTEIHFVEAVLPREGNDYRSSPEGETDLRFTRVKSGRYELRIRNRASGKEVYRMKDFRCEN